MNKTTTINKRLLSLDTLRGVDMFWIIGAEELVRHLAKIWPSFVPLSNQLSHADWIGLHAYDLVFPLFMFISGVAIPISLSRKLEQGASRQVIIRKVAIRVIILIILGIIYNGGLSFEKVRFASVLGQIGIAYMIASLIFLYTKNIKQQLYWMAGILVGYSALQLIVPVPGSAMGVLTAEGSINSWIDRMLIPGTLYRGGPYDPEGILSSISASFMTLTGVVTGGLFRSKNYSGNKKTLILIISGVVLLLAGILLSSFYPIIKRIWTSTFNMAAGGISLLLMALFYWIIDVRKIQRWTFFFRVIGLNSITIYLIHRIVDIESISEFLFSGVHLVTKINSQLVILVGIIVIEWVLLYFLYKRKIFLKV